MGLWPLPEAVEYDPIMSLEERNLRQLGHRIRLARKSKSLTQEELAEKAGLSTTYIGRLERGEKTPSVQTLVILAESLGISPLDLLVDLEGPLGRHHVKERIRSLLEML